MARTIKGYKIKRGQEAAKRIRKGSNMTIKRTNYIPLSKMKKLGRKKMGEIVLRQLKGSAAEREAKLNCVDSEISNIFSGRRDSLRDFLGSKKLSPQERTVLIGYASAKIARFMESYVKSKFTIRRTSSQVKISPKNIEKMSTLLSGIPGLNKNSVKEVITQINQNIYSLQTGEHMQLASMSFLSKYVLPKQGTIPSGKYISEFIKTVKEVESLPKEKRNYQEFYKRMEDKKLFRLLGVVGAEEKVLFYSKKSRPSTIIHESIHNVLNRFGERQISWSEPFVTLVTNSITLGTRIEADYFSPRRSFANKLPYAIANFPWIGITARDINILAQETNRAVKRNPKLKKLGYASFVSEIGEIIAPSYLMLLERKVENYPASKKRIVARLLDAGIEDLSGSHKRKDLIKIMERIKTKL